jgi:hypothetical protein
MELLRSPKAKKVLGFVSPIIIIVVLMLFMNNFREVKELSAEEVKAIETYKKEIMTNNATNQDGIFPESDFEILSKAFRDLHEYANYQVFGPQWGYKIDNVDEQWKKIDQVINKPEYKIEKFKDFFDALRDDIAVGKTDYGKRPSHDALHDLASLVFTETILPGEKQWGQTKTVQLMKEMGLKMVVKKEKNNNNNSTDTQADQE